MRFEELPLHARFKWKNTGIKQEALSFCLKVSCTRYVMKSWVNGEYGPIHHIQAPTLQKCYDVIPYPEDPDGD